MNVKTGQKFKGFAELLALLEEGEAVVAIQFSKDLIMAHGDSRKFADPDQCYELSCNWSGAGIQHPGKRLLLCGGKFNPPCVARLGVKCQSAEAQHDKCFG